jgi:hypothetical protein
MSDAQEYELSKGVTYEELKETPFSSKVGGIKCPFVRLQPYNQEKPLVA